MQQEQEAQFAEIAKIEKKQEEARCVQMPALPVPGPARKSRTHSVLYTVGFRTPFRIANAFGEYVFLKKSTNLGREETNQTHTSQRPRGRVVGACRVADAVAHADAAALAAAAAHAAAAHTLPLLCGSLPLRP